MTRTEILNITHIVNSVLLVLLIIWVVKMINNRSGWICGNCGQVGRQKTLVRGSIIIEIVLWFCLIIPGLIYSLWRSTSGGRQKVCPSCLQPAMVKIKSPRGRELVEKYHNQPAIDAGPAKTGTKSIQ